MADLTRFDFNAHNFLNSENVEVMTDAEIGQYVMLLAKAWTLAKATSLPDDPELLAKWGHCKRVSDRVMARFPIENTEFGSRRRNDVLYREWLKALDRTNIAVESGRVGAAARWGGHRDSIDTKIAQTNPNQAIPSQSNDSGNFKNMAVRYRRAFHVNLSHGTLQKDEYAKACREFSEDLVLDKFDIWAPDNTWIKERRNTNGLRQFYESLPAIIEADISIESGKRAEETSKLELQNILDSSVSAAQEAHRLEEEDLRRKRELDVEIESRVAADPDALFR